jgi:hypothetical protein
MHVIAFSSPSRPAWRWRLISYAGDIVEESRDVFRSIAEAIGAGAVRSEELRVRDISQPVLPYAGSLRRGI